MSIEKTTDKVKECLRRLNVAHDHAFPWHVRLQLLSEAMTAMCENQVELSSAVVSLLVDVRAGQERLREQIEKRFGS